MTKADLHVHSMYSERPSNWFLQRLGASESYTDPDFIYSTALSKGMDLVTVTDHNRMDASLYLKEKYPDRVFTGVETTAYFPEDKCKIHILLYGMDEKQFAEVQKIRTDIYHLREFIIQNRIAHSVAHATYSINGRISVEKLEKLILLFDVFEGINGGRSTACNTVLTEMLNVLNPSIIEELYSRHRIEPSGKTPWIKSSTGGSDDHAGLFIGKAYTVADAATPDGFLESIRNRQTCAEGNHNDYKSLAFTIYKIAYDFSVNRSSSLRLGSIARLGEAVLKQKVSEDFTASDTDSEINSENAQIRLLLSALADDIASRNAETDTDIWLERVYDRITSVSDGFFRSIIVSMVSDMRKGNFDNFIKNISSMIPGIFLSVPFFMTLRHMNDSRELIDSINRKYLDSGHGRKKILWFTDTYHELNGVASTMREIAGIADEKGRDIKIVTALPKKENDSGTRFQHLPDSVMDLSYFLDFRLPYYENIEIRIPSLLACVKKLDSEEVDEIHVSTPGPVGIIGLILSRLLNVRCTGIYHTDFAAQAAEITGSESMSGIIDSYIRFYYSLMDEILVPTSGYIDLLSERGFEKSKMRIFRRAIDTDLFSPAPDSDKYLEKTFGIRNGKILLYAGRVSNDKAVDMIVDIYRRLYSMDENYYLIIAGDGPDLPETRKKTADMKGVILAGALERENLPAIYAACDLLVFPSVTDTFGMVVLEAQSCGLPAFVSDVGGPMEIIVDGITGRVLPAGNISAWTDAINDFFETMRNDRTRHAAMKAASRKRAHEFGWDMAFEHIFREKKTRVEDNLIKTGFNRTYPTETGLTINEKAEKPAA